MPWIDDRLFGEDEPVDRKCKCPTCKFKTITDCALLCPECGDQLEPHGELKQGDDHAW